MVASQIPIWKNMLEASMKKFDTKRKPYDAQLADEEYLKLLEDLEDDIIKNR